MQQRDGVATGENPLLGLAMRAAALLARWHRAELAGAERLPDGPALLVGNHGLFGLETPVFFWLLHRATGRMPWGLSDRVVFGGPIVRQLLERASERLDRPALLGSSFGGAVAALVALRGRVPLGALLLVGAVLSRRQIPLATPLFVDLLEAPEPLARLVSPLAAQVMGGFALDREGRDELVREARHFTGRELKRRLRALLALDLFPELPRLGALPVLFVHGRRDLLVPWRAGRRAAERVPGARFDLLSRAGHVPYLSHPAPFNAAVARFLGDAAAVGAGRAAAAPGAGRG